MEVCTNFVQHSSSAISSNDFRVLELILIKKPKISLNTMNMRNIGYSGCLPHDWNRRIILGAVAMISSCRLFSSPSLPWPVISSRGLARLGDSLHLSDWRQHGAHTTQGLWDGRRWRHWHHDDVRAWDRVHVLCDGDDLSPLDSIQMDRGCRSAGCLEQLDRKSIYIR